MTNQLTLSRPEVSATDDANRGTGRVLVRYQVGNLLIDSEGYGVWDSFHGETTVPAGEDVGTALENHIADTYPGLELVDWHIPLSPDPF